MNSTPKADHESLRRLFQSANERVAREPVPWQPPSSWPKWCHSKLAPIGGALVLGLLASYLFAIDSPSPYVAESVPALRGADPAKTPPNSGPVPLTPPYSTGSLEHKGPAGLAPHENAIRWVGGTLMIDLQHVPVHQAIQMLAAETQTSVHGAELITGNGVTLAWRGRDVRAAWQELLGPLTGFSMVCTARTCTVWVDGHGVKGVARSTTASQMPSAAQSGATAATSSPSEAEEPAVNDD